MDEPVHDTVVQYFTEEHVCEKSVESFIQKVQPNVRELHPEFSDEETRKEVLRLWNVEKAMGPTARTSDCPQNFVNKEGGPGYVKGKVHVSLPSRNMPRHFANSSLCVPACVGHRHGF